MPGEEEWEREGLGIWDSKTQTGVSCLKVVKNLPANAGDSRDVGSILGWGRSSGVGNGNLLQYSCLVNTMDRGAWQAYSPWGRKVSDMTEHNTAHT